MLSEADKRGSDSLIRYEAKPKPPSMIPYGDKKKERL